MKRTERIKRSLNAQIRRHVGKQAVLNLVHREYPGYQVSNIQILLGDFFCDVLKTSRILGSKLVRGTSIDDDFAINELTEEARFSTDGGFHGVEEGPLLFKKPVPDEVDARMGLTQGLVFCEFRGHRMVVFGKSEERVFRKFVLAIVCSDVGTANELLSSFDEYIEKHSIFRGKTLVPSFSYSQEIEEVKILPASPVEWADLILPVDLQESMQVNILEYIRLAPIVRKNGFEAKRGILFYGPPGTGKSLACRALASRLPTFTKFILTGDDQTKAKAAFDLARRFRPSLLIYEDIDMVGSAREENQLRSTLSELMNELDGLGDRDDVYVIFTTNHIDYLESALVARPGRIDLPYEFLLPTDELRLRLMRLYAKKAHLQIEDFGIILERTRGTTPAFIKELMRRALLQAVIAHDYDPDGFARIKDHYVYQALAELQETVHPSARKMVGFAS